MKKFFLILSFLPTILFAQNNSFVITGDIQGLKDGEDVKITSTQENSQLIAKASIKGGAFLVKGSIPEPGLYWLTLGSEQPQHIYLENKPIKVSGIQKDIKNIKIEGSQSHKEFATWNAIVLKPGEQYKIQDTVDSVIGRLIEMGVDRKTMLVGIGGGVITDLTGYIGSVYMRGIQFGFVPTTLLSMVDASIGGKNGIDVGLYKNMVGCITQPSFILHDLGLLNTLPEQEWKNGFAEIIKHAAIKDAVMFRELEATKLAVYRKKKKSISLLIQRNAVLKTKLVQADEFEQGDRKLLNFGHTLGHALENQYNLMHGEAVAIGMAFAGKLSQKYSTFKQANRLIKLIDRYGLPVTAGYNHNKVFDILQTDKKRESNLMNFILLKSIGKAYIEKIPLEQLYNFL